MEKESIVFYIRHPSRPPASTTHFFRSTGPNELKVRKGLTTPRKKKQSLKRPNLHASMIRRRRRTLYGDQVGCYRAKHPARGWSAQFTFPLILYSLFFFVFFFLIFLRFENIKI
jgi:hypothetical protein